MNRRPKEIPLRAKGVTWRAKEVTRGPNHIAWVPREVNRRPYQMSLGPKKVWDDHIRRDCLLENKCFWSNWGYITPGPLIIFAPSFLSRFFCNVSVSSWPVLIFKNFLMQQYLLSICDAKVEAASFYLPSVKIRSKNKMTSLKAILQ